MDDTQQIIDTSIIESGASLAMIVGTLAIFQWSSEALYQVGAVVFLLGFLAYIASLFLNRLHWRILLERLLVLLMITGILGMFQPWNIRFYEYGFYIVGLSTLSFIIVLHIPAPDEA